MPNVRRVMFAIWLTIRFPPFDTMKTSARWLRHSVAIVVFAAQIVLAGCAGVSTAAPQSLAPPPTHSVYLSWDQSTSPDILGYNIYRAVYANSCGSFSKINPEPTAETIYTDSAVANGASYCYATTAVNAKKEESGLSEIVLDVQIPAD